jgi:uncharacterized hydrophobic protein (TIGR00271 family)
MSDGDAPRGPFLDWWRDHVVTAVDHRSVIGHVHDEAVWSGRFAFMTLMSAGIAILGLLLSSPAVVIGAMLISPLMGPIIGLGFGLALFDFSEIRRAVLSLVVGVVLAVLFCALIVLLSPLQTVTPEIAARTRPNLFDLGVAIFSGLAGTYATIRGRQGAIVGVAIAVALMPPLAAMGFGLATLNLPILWGATFLFLTNLIAIGFSAAVLARIYGFAGRLSPRQTWLQALLVLGTLAALAVPLGLALRQIAWEAVVSRQARETIVGRFDLNARVSQLVVDYDSEPIGVRAVVFTPALRPGVDTEATRLLTEALDQPVEVSIEQVRIGNADAQAAQLAEARGATTDPAADRVARRLSLVAGVPLDSVLVDRSHHVARVRAVPLPGATLRTYQELEARAAAGEDGWTILLVPPPVALPVIPSLTDPPTAEDQAILATVAWGATRLALPVGVSGRDAAAIISRLREAGVDARQSGTGAGPNRLVWLAPDGAAAP